MASVFTTSGENPWLRTLSNDPKRPWRRTLSAIDMKVYSEPKTRFFDTHDPLCVLKFMKERDLDVDNRHKLLRRSDSAPFGHDGTIFRVEEKEWQTSSTEDLQQRISRTHADHTNEHPDGSTTGAGQPDFEGCWREIQIGNKKMNAGGKYKERKIKIQGDSNKGYWRFDWAPIGRLEHMKLSRQGVTQDQIRTEIPGGRKKYAQDLWNCNV